MRGALLALVMFAAALITAHQLSGALMPTVPQCPLNASVVLMLTTQPILPSGNMIVTYGPPGPWTVVKYDGVEYLLQINMWNLASVGYGNETLTFNNRTGEVCFSSYISNVTLISPSGGVWGYPGIYLVGIFPGGSVNIKNPLLPLPLTVRDLVNGSYSDRFLVLNYSLFIPDGEPMDWSYDIWFTTSPAPSASLNHGAELMIWLYTTTPIFSWADTGIRVNIPVYVNGSLVNETFDIHVDCYHGSSSTYWTYIAFVPVNGGFENGYVNISLKPFLQYMVDVFPRVCPSLWASPSQVANLWMDVVTLGSEYGNVQWVSYPGWGVIAWRIYEAKVAWPGLATATVTRIINVTSTTTVTTTTTVEVLSPVTVTSTYISNATATVTTVETLTSTIIKIITNTQTILYLVIVVVILTIVLAAVALKAVKNYAH